MDNNVQILAIFNNLMRNVFQLIFEDDSDESDEENNDFINLVVNVPQERNEVVRISGYLERVIPEYTENQFQSHFRLTQHTFHNLLRMISPMLNRQDNFGRHCINPEKQLLSVLWLLATQDSYRSVGDRFGMSKSSLFVSFERVVMALNRIASQVIMWPRGDRIIEITNSFQRFAGVPNVIGAVDGTFVPIKAPSQDPEVYVTRKCNYAITLQAICDAELKFIDVFAGYPGSVNDQRIFRNSDIYRNITANPNNYFPEGHFIIGDKAYPSLNWCVPPYIDRGRLTAAQRNFNNLISKTRQPIERSFALLFGRFRRLRYLDMNRNDLIPATVLGACVLHNICLNGIDDNLNNYEAEGAQFVNPDNDEIGNIFNNNVPGIQFRDQLCELLNNR